MLNALHLCLEKKRVKEDGGTSEKLDTNPEDADLDIDGSVIIECRCLKSIMEETKFRFILCAVLKLLRYIEPANNILQSRESGLASALPVLKDVLQKIIESRSDESFQEVLQDSIKLLPNSNTPICGGSADGDPQSQGGASRDGNQRRKRARKMNRNFEDFIVELPATTSNENVKQIYFEIFDRARAEFDRCFTSNEKLIHVVDKISYADFSDYSELQYLEQYGIVIPKKEELECVKTHFVNNNLNKDNYLLTLFKLNKVNVFTESYNILLQLQHLVAALLFVNQVSAH